MTRARAHSYPAGSELKSLAERVLQGDQAAASRALSLMTDEGEGCGELLRILFPRRRGSHKIGLCGPPGSGKSSLVNRMVAGLRARGETVGVLAVDPTSPFTGGAFLGDRLRVAEHALDRGVFMRSLASRGMMGGLNPTIFGAIHVLEACGFDRILIETVGTGQDEVEIVHAADTVLCVSAPYQGDEFQAMKAGAMEIADLFVVNKADLADIEKALANLRDALSLGSKEEKAWKPPVLAVSALQATGITELLDAADSHRDHLAESGEGALRLRAQLRRELSLLLSRRIYRETLSLIRDEHIERLASGKDDPAALAERIGAGKTAERGSGRGPMKRRLSTKSRAA